MLEMESNYTGLVNGVSGGDIRDMQTESGTLLTVIEYKTRQGGKDVTMVAIKRVKGSSENIWNYQHFDC